MNYDHLRLLSYGFAWPLLSEARITQNKDDLTGGDGSSWFVVPAELLLGLVILSNSDGTVR